MDPLICGLTNPGAYDHPVDTVTVMETHISWVLLAGDYAYKIKKPVDFGFLDFSTLEKRRQFCWEEVRLNRRLASMLYLDVLAITGTRIHPAYQGGGAVIDYAVKMRRFEQGMLFDKLLERDQLNGELMDALADTIAAFHGVVEKSTAEDRHGIPAEIHSSVLENFQQISPQPRPRAERRRLARLRAWCNREFRQIQQPMLARKGDGFVRECHGDLHLGNIVLLDSRPVPFDCIEFSEKLRWIDVVSELAFTLMDLLARRRPDLGFRLLNRYLSRTGDYPGLALLRYYLVYRAMVRAKIAMLSVAQQEEEARQRDLIDRYLGYVALAESFTRPVRPCLAVCHGFSGSGKSHVASDLAEMLPALWLRSDVERKRLMGLAAEARTDSRIAGGIYGEEATRATYHHLAETAETALRAGYAVIVDAAFLKSWQRRLLQDTAEACGAGYCILDIQAPEGILRQRIRQRLEASNDPSEANLNVLDHQLTHSDPLSPEEADSILVVDSTNRMENALAETVRRMQKASRTGV